VDANTRINISYDDLEKMIDEANNYTLASSSDDQTVNSSKTFFYEDLN
jgi:hypothetical protein